MLCPISLAGCTDARLTPILADKYHAARFKTVEKRIWDVERFDVVIKRNGKDVHGNKKGLPQYPNERMAKNDMTAAQWKDNRFCAAYPGYDVDVLDGDANLCHGNTKLGTVRDSYSDE